MLIRIPGNPIAKKRPRFARRGKFVTTYSDQQTEEGKAMAIILSQLSGKPTSEPVQIEFVFRMARPKGHYGSGKNCGNLKPSAPVHHTAKPDVDNLIKFYMDCLNGLAWVDDSQVIRIGASKVYVGHGQNGPETAIILTSIGGELG